MLLCCTHHIDKHVPVWPRSYIRATECGLQMLLRLARREVRVRAWMAEPAPDTDGEDSGEEWEGRASNILRPRDQLE